MNYSLLRLPTTLAGRCLYALNLCLPVAALVAFHGTTMHSLRDALWVLAGALLLSIPGLLYGDTLALIEARVADGAPSRRLGFLPPSWDGRFTVALWLLVVYAITVSAAAWLEPAWSGTACRCLALALGLTIALKAGAALSGAEADAEVLRQGRELTPDLFSQRAPRGGLAPKPDSAGVGPAKADLLVFPRRPSDPAG